MAHLLVAILTVRREHLDAFHAYEAKAAAIMARHGGAIERALLLDEGAAGDTLRELHVVRFADAAGFAAYRADPDAAALREEREACIVATEVWPAREGPTYGITSSSRPS